VFETWQYIRHFNGTVLFNNAIRSSDSQSNESMNNELKGSGQKWSWPNCKVVFQNLPAAATEEKMCG
jgi:hypothetical protein